MPTHERQEKNTLDMSGVRSDMQQNGIPDQILDFVNNHKDQAFDFWDKHKDKLNVAPHELPIVIGASATIPFSGVGPALGGAIGGIGSLRALESTKYYKNLATRGQRLLNGAGAATLGTLAGLMIAKHLPFVGTE